MSKAAELLGISQPAVSRLIADFQEAVGFQIFKRKRYSAEPTPDARQLFDQVEKLFYGLEELNNQISAIKSLHTGKVVISATSSYATGLLPEVIAKFKKQHPKIAIAVYIHPHEQVVEWVASGRADIGFVIQPVANTELNVAQFMGREAHCIFPAGHALGDKKILHPKDLANLPFVSFPRGTPLRFQIDGVFDRLGVERLLHVEATSHHAVCALVSVGLGVALVNPFSPIAGYPTQLDARPMKPSVMIDLKMFWNDSSLSIVTTSFRDFFLKTVAKHRMVELVEPKATPRSISQTR